MKKSMFRILFLLILIFMLIFTLSSCSGDFTVEFNTQNGEAIESQTVVKGELAIEPATPQKKGYHFLGWYVNGSKWSFLDNVVESDITLVAKWEYITYKIEYDLCGGEFSETALKEYNVDTEYTIPTPTRKGYTFIGWTTPEQTTPIVDYQIAKGTVSDTVISANWSPISYTISFNLQGGAFSESVISELTVETSYTVPSPTRKGYAFTGWTTESSNELTPTYLITPGTTENISLTANWIIKTYSISYDLQGGFFSSLPLSGYNIDTSYTVPTPDKYGYTFLGWTTTDISSPQASFSITPGTLSSDISLTANWTATNYSLSYDLKGGSFTEDTLAQYTVETAYTVPIPSRIGYSFVGWTSPASETPIYEYKIATGTINNITLIANWSINEYSISYKLNHGHFENTPLYIYTIETTYTVPTPKRQGYIFIGWCTSENQTPILDYTINIGTINNISLSACWEPEKYSISYELNGGTNSPQNTNEYSYGGEQKIYPAQKQYADFLGWTVKCSHNTDEDSNNICDECSFQYTRTYSNHIYTITSNYIFDLIFIANWKCNHNDENSDGECDICYSEIDEELVYYWDEVSLIFQMTNNTASGVLSSGCERYLAGEYTGVEQEIDQMVDGRNAEAMEHAKISEITYRYYDDTNEYNWRYVSAVIYKEISSNNTEELPDVYVNYVNDLVAASLKGSFANLYGTVRGQQNNYLPLLEFRDALEAGAYNESTSNGYMYNYMSDLTVSRNKMYILASDYFTDLVRAFYIVPVNIKLLEEVGLGITGDLVGDSDGFTIDDFYEEVKQGKWTYSKLAAYSAAIYKDEQNKGHVDIDDRVGFALAENDFSAMGLLYTNSCTILNKKWNPRRCEYEYFYLSDNQKLYDLVDQINVLFKSTGVLSVDSSEGVLAYGDTQLEAIRNRFADDKILFGGITLVGSLEDEVYQEMKYKSGLGVVPVPLYSDDTDDKYITQISNVGRAGAISVKSQKFEQCTAFLDFLSTNSTDILNEYYNYKLQYDATDGNPGTVYMLQYIRNNVGSSFDMTIEAPIGAVNETMYTCWHKLLYFSGYQIDIRSDYAVLWSEKQDNITAFVRKYEELPD